MIRRQTFQYTDGQPSMVHDAKGEWIAVSDLKQTLETFIRANKEDCSEGDDYEMGVNDTLEALEDRFCKILEVC